MRIYQYSKFRAVSNKNLSAAKLFSGKLKEIADRKYDGVWGRMARAAGIPTNTFAHYWTGQGLPNFERIVQIIVGCGVNSNWLLLGEGEMYDHRGGYITAAGHALPLDKIEEEYVFLPLLDVEASAGQGMEVYSEQVRALLAFRLEFIRRDLGAAEDDLFLIPVVGDSMIPTLHPGEVVLVDKRFERIVTDGIYVVGIRNTILVKRVRNYPTEVHLASDNPDYPPIVISVTEGEPEELRVLGRVVWGGRRY